MADRHIKEATHYYSKSGEPVYETPSADGSKMVKTTLAHARKKKLMPSVTTVLKMMDKPSVTEWLIDLYLKGIFGLKREWETFSDFDEFKKFAQDSIRVERESAAKAGTDIHAMIGSCFEQNLKHSNPDIVAICKKVKQYFDAMGCDRYDFEISFASKMGYAGCVDMRCFSGEDIMYIVDFKTTNEKQYPKIIKKPYDDYRMQGAAYSAGMFPLWKKPQFVNWIINRDNLDQHEPYTWKQADLEDGLEMFLHVLSYWELKNKYSAAEEF